MFKIIEELKRGDAKQKQALLLRTHASNVEYFSRANPKLAEFIKTRGTGPFSIHATDESLDIIDRQTNQPIHPAGELFSCMSELGEVHHAGWVDKVMMGHVWRGDGEHGKLLKEFADSLYTELPELNDRLARGKVSLPPMKDKRSFSGPVVFLGVFTGLHIMYYLSRVAAHDVFLIEPNVDSFALSCFFLDYQALEKQFGYLNLHVGANAPQFLIDGLTSRSPVTASSWVRVLPAYQSEQFDDILNRIGLRWRALYEIYVPMDREKQNLVNGLSNIRNGLPLLRHSPRLSGNATVAVVGSGPSLNANMEWLKANQDKMIILASISSVRVLRENGIRPDFQCTLDTELDETILEKLRLDFDDPLVVYYKMNPELVRRFKKALLLHDDGKANSVQFLRSFTHTHPTTGNLMSAVAAWCKPRRLLFLGLDFGFRDAKRSHVSGGWHDDDEGSGHEAAAGQNEHLPVTANFPESEGQILTMAYYNSARLGVESAIAALQGQEQIFNLADGARIKGAAPMRSSELLLPDYPEKAQDLKSFEQGFSKVSADVFDIYETSGQQLIKELTECVIKRVELKKFNWPEFAMAIDGAWNEAAARCVNKHREFRIEIFGTCVMDLLAEWYRAMVLAESAKNVERVYRKGLIELKKALSSLPWPKELDALLEAETEAGA